MSDPLEGLRDELRGLVRLAGGDADASEMLSPYCAGFPPDRSTIGRFRRGEGKPALLAMTVDLLRRAIRARESGDVQAAQAASNADALEQLARQISKLDRLIAASGHIGVPPRIHLAGLRNELPKAREAIKEAYMILGGEDIWS